MDCTSCVAAIIKIKAVNGVSEVDADLRTKKVTVQTKNSNLCQEDVTCMVKDLGYKVQVPQHIQLPLEEGLGNPSPSIRRLR